MRFQVCVRSTERLDRFLADQLALSRTQVGRLIGDGAVTINDDRARASRTLVHGDTVEVQMPEEAPPRQLVPFHHPIDIVFEDEFLLVLDKPAGLVVHPAPGHWDDTLLNALVARGTSLSQETGRPGIVHRLDKDTSGLMIVAKTDDVHRALSRELSRRRIRRVYATLIWGHIAKPTDIEAAIGRNPQDRKRMAVLATGRPALTHVEPVARFDATDLLRVSLASGRTHQIRVHLAHIGHPIVGDPVYHGGGSRRVAGQQRSQAKAIERATPRQALHAALLEFRHPVSSKMTRFVSEWPPDLRQCLAAAAADEGLLDRPNPLEYFDFPPS